LRQSRRIVSAGDCRRRHHLHFHGGHEL
jgi:hypothetical protein